MEAVNFDIGVLDNDAVALAIADVAVALGDAPREIEEVGVPVLLVVGVAVADPVPVGVVLWRVNAGGSAIAVPANAGGTPALTPGIATSKLSLTQRGRLRAR